MRIFVGIILVLVLVAIGFVFFNPVVGRLDLEKELNASKVASTVYDRNGEPIATLYAKTRLWIPADEIPQHLKEAFIVTEDKRFYKHKGIDLRGIFRALYQDIRAKKKIQGGSTITQQLVKNIFLTHEKSFARKFWEMAYAIRIEQQYSKEEILEFYLNSIFLGHGTWGIAGGAQVYFGKGVNELTIAECAMLAGLTKSPENYSPFRNSKLALERRNVVLELMYAEKMLTNLEFAEACIEKNITLNKPGSTYVGAWFVDYILEKLRREINFSEEELRGGGYRIYTTMDRRIQLAAERTMSELPEGKADQWGVMQPQGALVAIEPHDGEIIALVGGRRFSAAENNRSFQIHRQPGSAVKPFAFAAALENGYSAEDTYMSDEPLELTVGDTVWKPQNNDNEYRGWINLKTALQYSVNMVAIRLVQELGLQTVFEMSRRLGIESLVSSGNNNDLALAPLALGGYTKGVSLLELTSAYSAFANDGVKVKPYGIVRVYDSRGRLVYRAEPQNQAVISKEIADQLSLMMQEVVRAGTGKSAGKVGVAAGKTGTTNRNTNGWFIGYNDKILAGIWIGNDRSGDSLIVKGVPLGSSKAAALWGDFLRRGRLCIEESREDSPKI